MAIENVGVSEPTTPDRNIASDRIDGLDHQSIKILVGTDGNSEGWVGTSRPLPTQNRRATSINYGQLNVGDAAGGAQIRPTNSSRMWVVVYNAGNNPIALGGDNSITYATGLPLWPGGQSPMLACTCEIRGIADTGLTVDIRYFELVE